MIILLAAALIGSSVTSAALWTYGAPTALLAAPFGGSIFTLIAGVLLVFMRTKQERNQERKVQIPPEKPKAAA
ncbi:hypothetical protein [Microvirga aerophila]|uniref:hypothetical protein n=1 Tax=Microvirga aerophila TaxID=670291 RepID=UPI000DEF2ACF|nr:hypothetical protein [Microvirga aerophila]